MLFLDTTSDKHPAGRPRSLRKALSEVGARFLYLLPYPYEIDLVEMASADLAALLPKVATRTCDATGPPSRRPSNASTKAHIAPTSPPQDASRSDFEVVWRGSIRRDLRATQLCLGRLLQGRGVERPYRSSRKEDGTEKARVLTGARCTCGRTGWKWTRGPITRTRTHFASSRKVRPSNCSSP